MLPTLDRQLDGNGENVCDIVCLMGPEARPLLSKLLDALAHPDYWDLQWAAADAIGHVASADPETLQALKEALGHESAIVRSAAARALGRIGAPAVPLLIDMLGGDTGAKTQSGLPRRLGICDRSPYQPRQFCVRSWSVRTVDCPWAAIALGKIASEADAVPVLIEILEDNVLTDAWRAACKALAAIGAPATASREHLTALKTCPIEEIQRATEMALAAIDRARN